MSMTATAAIFIRPVMPLWLLAAMVLLMALCSWFSYKRCPLHQRQRYGLWTLRMASVLVLALILMQPERRVVKEEREPPVVAVVVDVSASMDDTVQGVSVKRRQRAVDFLTDRKVSAQLSPYRLVHYALDAKAYETSEKPEKLEFNAPGSNLGTGLNTVMKQLQDKNAIAIILLSDGLDRSGQELLAGVTPLPILVPELEPPVQRATGGETDFWIADLAYPKRTVINWKTTVTALLRRRGTGKTAFPVNLYCEGRVLRTSVVQFDENDRFQQLSFTVEPPETGQLLYRLEAAPPEDSKPENNARDFIIEVTDPENRVLYLEGPPRWEFKFLKNAFMAEPNFRLSAFVHAGPGGFINFSETGEGTGAALPELTAEELKKYKVVILGDLNVGSLDQQNWQNLREFVDKGGGLLLVGGTNALGPAGYQSVADLRDLLPASSEPGARMQEGRYSVALTAAGRAHPAMGQFATEAMFPPLLSFWGTVKIGGFASVLVAAADGSPVVCVRRYGQGKVAMFLTDSLWRWQMGSSYEGGEKNLYAGFVTQMAYWLTPTQDNTKDGNVLQIFTAENEVDVRARVVIGAVTGDSAAESNQAPACTVTTPDGRVLPLPMVPATLGTEVGISRAVQGFQCVLIPHVAGRYEVKIVSADGTQHADQLLLAKEPELEKTGEPMNRDYLLNLAESTGGGFFGWNDRHLLLKRLSFDPHTVRIVSEYPIWNRFWWLIVLVGLFTTEWWWRRRLDLV